jgi:hypothetical protein
MSKKLKKNPKWKKKIEKQLKLIFFQILIKKKN